MTIKKKVLALVFFLPLIILLAQGYQYVRRMYLIKFASAYAPLTEPDCFTDYRNWKYSNKYRDDAPFSLGFTVSTSYNTPQANEYKNFVDINGDGLIDYIYSEHYGAEGYYLKNRDCVYLNNGRGWEPVYRCVAYVDRQAPIEPPKYYGDCALMN